MSFVVCIEIFVELVIAFERIKPYTADHSEVAKNFFYMCRKYMFGVIADFPYSISHLLPNWQISPLALSKSYIDTEDLTIINEQNTVFKVCFFFLAKSVLKQMASRPDTKASIDLTS
ncbi:unnamed protein product [Rhizopus stolonifer]